MYEYDTPIIEGFDKGYHDAAIEFMRPLLGKALKEDNPYLKKGLITGIMRIAKESLFSGLNNAGIYTITSLNFSDKFGFMEAEVKAQIKQKEYYQELMSHQIAFSSSYISTNIRFLSLDLIPAYFSVYKTAPNKKRAFP